MSQEHHQKTTLDKATGDALQAKKGCDNIHISRTHVFVCPSVWHRGKQPSTSLNVKTAPSLPVDILKITSKVIPTKATSHSHQHKSPSQLLRPRPKFPSNLHLWPKRSVFFFPGFPCFFMNLHLTLTELFFVCFFKHFQTGGMKAGTFSAYPVYSAEPYVLRQAKRSQTEPVFRPASGPKSTPVKSIIAVNTNRFVSLTTFPMEL